MKIHRTTSDNDHFRQLVALLDQELAEIDGDDHAFYAQFNKTDQLKQCIVAYTADQPVGCGAIRAFGDDAVEIKRMYVLPECRGKGIATQILAELETWTAELGYLRCVLETGKRQPDAIHLYEKTGYRRIPNFGQYIGVDNSVCLEKRLRD